MNHVLVFEFFSVHQSAPTGSYCTGPLKTTMIDVMVIASSQQCKERVQNELGEIRQK